ncbi:LPXTG cell wall anchor domain-containing protein [Paenibacillus sp. 19GGS1-52]|uniref:LPXTG cell wall anchor domain-containing protein n=1 Tax=Paenibacillus sp. 19GGS1-52 TaxID=2758563 RepID=UPI001EFBF45F|nr:LPXTG cell wall anchor domain-containing protein [Paenibacillus sp. 19GGS1-52]ULO09258.1 LPXTG cell wall anchor domain-containing protein [Paenibacillus sp. 19GGS1-52]
MIKKRTSLLIVILILITQYAYGMGYTSQVKAAAIENERDIITSVSMAVYGPDGNTVTDSVYEQNSNVTLDYTWSLPNNHSYVSGDTFTFQLPVQFQLFNDINGALVSDEGDVGTFKVNQSSHQVVMTFNDYIEQHDNVQGTLRIKTNFDKQVISQSTTQQILFPVNGGIQTVTVNFRPSVGSTIEKKGTAQGFNAHSILWTVDVNKTLEAVGNAVVTDPMPAGLSLDAPLTLAVYQLDVQLNGTVSQGALIDSSKYTANIAAGTLTVHFNDPVITSAYRIEYSTSITDDNQNSFTNTATFTGDDRVPAASSYTVNVERGGSLKKYSTAYEWGTQTITWAIEYNYNHKIIPQEKAVLTDLFNNSQYLVGGSLKVYPVTLDSSGAATKGIALAENVDYTVSDAVDAGKKGFRLQFANEIPSSYRIEYKTKATERVFSDTTITNSVTDSTYTEQATQLIRPVIIYKTLSGVDYQTKKADWKVTINGDNYPMGQVVITDTFPQGGLQFIPESLVIKNGSGVVLSSTNYQLDYVTPAQPNKGFKVVFNSAISGTYTIGYQTFFNKDWIWGTTDNFINNARIDWVDDSANPHWTEAKGLFIPRIEEKNNGFKSGSYNATAKEITWTVGVNYNSKAIEDPEVTDLLKAGQVLVPGSLKVYTMKIAKNGDPSQGIEVNKNLYNYSVDSNNQLKVDFLESINTPYYVVFTTSLEGQLINSIVNNTAALFDGSMKVSKDLTAAVSIPHGDEYVVKNGAQNGDKIDWRVLINAGQSYVLNAVLTDTPSSNQILLPDSFHLYPTAVAVDGAITKSGPELVKDTDYSVAINSDTEGKQTFILSFAHGISTAYMLEYQSLIVANSGDKVTNTVNFSGNNVILVTRDTSKEIIVGLSSGSGTGSGVRGTLTVKKLDAQDNTKLLSGATFALYRLSGSERLLINTLTTDSSGIVSFNKIWLGSYILTETRAPEGYVLDNREYPVTINSATAIQLSITNQQSETPATEPPVTESPGPTASVTPVESASPTPTPSPTAGIPGSVIVPTPTSSATPGIIIDDLAIPAGPGITTDAQPTPDNGNTPDVVIPVDEEVPLGDVTIKDDEIPAGTVTDPAGANVSKLPKTGEDSPMPLYMAGISLILAGLILNRVFKRSKNQE